MRNKQLNAKIENLYFLGPDGSGKSTIAGFLAWWLRRREKCVVVSWLRGSHTFASVLARFLSRFKAFKGNCNPYYGICIPRKLENVWVFVEFVSMIPVYLFRFILPRVFGCIVVGDRGLPDFLTWLIITLRDPGIVKRLLGRFMFALIQRTSESNEYVYVRASSEILMARRKGSEEEHLIPSQLIIYDVLAKTLNLPVIDTSRGTSIQSFRRLIGILKRRNKLSK